MKNGGAGAPPPPEKPTPLRSTAASRCCCSCCCARRPPSSLPGAGLSLARRLWVPGCEWWQGCVAGRGDDGNLGVGGEATEGHSTRATRLVAGGEGAYKPKPHCAGTRPAPWAVAIVDDRCPLGPALRLANNPRAAVEIATSTGRLALAAGLPMGMSGGNQGAAVVVATANGRSGYELRN